MLCDLICSKKVGALHRTFPHITFLDLDEAVGAPQVQVALCMPEPHGTKLGSPRLVERILNGDCTEDGIIVTRSIPCVLFSERVSRPMQKKWGI